jgi:hypothetical protein
MRDDPRIGVGASTYIDKNDFRIFDRLDAKRRLILNDASIASVHGVAIEQWHRRRSRDGAGNGRRRELGGAYERDGAGRSRRLRDTVFHRWNNGLIFVASLSWAPCTI